MIMIELPVTPLIFAGAICLVFDIAAAQDNDLVSVMLCKYLFSIFAFFATYGACVMFGSM